MCVYVCFWCVCVCICVYLNVRVSACACVYLCVPLTVCVCVYLCDCMCVCAPRALWPESVCPDRSAPLERERGACGSWKQKYPVFIYTLYTACQPLTLHSALVAFRGPFKHHPSQLVMDDVARVGLGSITTSCPCSGQKVF